MEEREELGVRETNWHIMFLLSEIALEASSVHKTLTHTHTDAGFDYFSLVSNLQGTGHIQAFFFFYPNTQFDTNLSSKL